MARHVLYLILRNSEALIKMKDNTEDSTVQSSKDREIELISRKVSNV